MADTYVARIVEVPGGIRLEPASDASVAHRPNEAHVLGLSIALALGAADYEHHPEPRDPEGQTIEALISGDASMPWRRRPVDDLPASPDDDGSRSGCEPGTTPHVVCQRSESGGYRCQVRCLPAEQ